MKPIVSCVMATKNRPEFLRQAIHYYQSQTLAESELIVLDDSDTANCPVTITDNRVRYFRVSERTTVGAKLNMGIERAASDLIQKIDDDDYYRPDFLATMVAALRAHRGSAGAAGVESFLVWIQQTNELRQAPPRWFAGGTLCFHKKWWNTHPFPCWDEAEDAGFLRKVRWRAPVAVPEIYVLVRHGANTWQHTREGIHVDHLLMKQPKYDRMIEDCMGPQAAAFYEMLHGRSRRECPAHQSEIRQ